MVLDPSPPPLQATLWRLLPVPILMASPLNKLICSAVCCSVLQCVAVCGRVLQCVAVCCSVLQLRHRHIHTAGDSWNCKSNRFYPVLLNLKISNFINFPLLFLHIWPILSGVTWRNWRNRFDFQKKQWQNQFDIQSQEFSAVWIWRYVTVWAHLRVMPEKWAPVLSAKRSRV